jgi:hypothetical protein
MMKEQIRRICDATYDHKMAERRASQGVSARRGWFVIRAASLFVRIRKTARAMALTPQRPKWVQPRTWNSGARYQPRVDKGVGYARMI